MPNLMHFNTHTNFHETMSFLAFSADSDDIVVHLESYQDQDGIPHLKLTTDRGIVADSDATLKSKLLDSDVYVNLHDMYVMCDKGVKEDDCALWTDDGRLYIGSCFNEQLHLFESECSVPTVASFTLPADFDETDSISIEQATLANVSDACFDFTYAEIWRIDGIVSYRTGDERVSIATIANTISGDPQVVDESLPDLAIRIPAKVFKVMGMTIDTGVIRLSIDRNRKKLRVIGPRYSVEYVYSDGEFNSDTTEGLTDYMKFDTLAMMATVDMIYGINYLDPIAPVTVTPIDETTVSIEISNTDRYSATITMCGVHVFDTSKSIVLPMDVITMMIRKSNCRTLLLKLGDNGKLFMYYENKNFARKCMYFGTK